MLEPLEVLGAGDGDVAPLVRVRDLARLCRSPVLVGAPGCSGGAEVGAGASAPPSGKPKKGG